MAVPKSKVSKARRDKRRSSHWKLETPNLSPCQTCGELKMSHRVCGACGSYDGRTVIVMADKRK